MKKSFYKGGRPSVDRHYLLPPEARVPEALQIAEKGGVLVICGARGTGKTTLAHLLAAQLNADGRFAALVIACRRWANPSRTIAGIRRQVFWRGFCLPWSQRPLWRSPDGASGLRSILATWSQRSGVQTVLLLDSSEALTEEGRLAILKQTQALGSGEYAPLHLLVLLSERYLDADFKKFRRERIGSSYLEREVRFRYLERFSWGEVGTLLEMHTAASGQTFMDSAADAVHSLTRGEPARVAALAAAVVKWVPRRKTITQADVRKAFKRLWPSRPTKSRPGWNSTAGSTYSPPLQTRESAFSPGASAQPTPANAAEKPTAEKRPSTMPLLAAAMLIVILALTSLTLWRFRSLPSPSVHVPAPASVPASSLSKVEQIATISSPREFEDLCASMVANKEIFDACRRQLPVYELSYRWIDTRLLLKPDESLRLEHLGILYGLENPEGESARHTLGAILAAECRREQTAKPAAFEELFQSECQQALPTLTQMGIELDRKWMGIRSVDSDYEKR